MMLTGIFVLGTIANAFGSGCSIPKGRVPAWSPSYSVQGVISIPYAELKEPFFAWYDLPSNSSRIDYYGGVVKTFQLSNMGPYGSMLKIAPVTTETQLNVPTCLQVNGTVNGKVNPQAILPDLTNFQCVGTELVNGVECEKWTLTDTIGEKVNKYTMWLHWKKRKLPGVSRPVPVQYEMKGYNTLLGTHYDHYYLQYDKFTFETPSHDIFKVEPNMTCTHFPGPGIKHVATFNPLQEFIHNDHRLVEHAFNEFKECHNKNYNEKYIEHHKRREIFRQNFRFIHSKNRAGLSYQLSVNHLADRTDEELAALRGRTFSTHDNGASPFPYTPKQIAGFKDELPEQFDWRIYGAVTPVKDQATCGSCWSFGTTGTIEGAYFVKTGHLLRLSEQALVDCSWGEDNNGCDGGEDYRAYQWILKHGGLPLESDYGDYLGQDGNCHIDSVPVTAKITGYVNVTSGNENALRLAIFKHGPISISIDADHKTFSFYSNGVYYDSECKNKGNELDHSVLAVGYGTLNGKKYWLIKNSWSNLWGNDGYILMSSKDNNCGVMTSPTYVTM